MPNIEFHQFDFVFPLTIVSTSVVLNYNGVPQLNLAFSNDNYFKLKCILIIILCK